MTEASLGVELKEGGGCPGLAEQHVPEWTLSFFEKLIDRHLTESGQRLLLLLLLLPLSQ